MRFEIVRSFVLVICVGCAAPPENEKQAGHVRVEQGSVSATPEKLEGSEAAGSLCSLDFKSSTDVIIQAQYVSDRFHEPHLIDMKCPDRVLVAHLPEGGKAKEIDDLGWAIFEGPGTVEFYVKARGHYEEDGARPIFKGAEVLEVFRLR